MTRVYSYTRFSDPRQAAGHSVERQIELAAAWAASRGFVLDASLSMHDEGLSAYHKKHITQGAFGIFLAAVEAGRIERGSILLVEQFDRLSRRTPMEAFRQFSDILLAGITIVTTKDGVEHSAASLEANPFRIFESILPMILANQESSNKSKRVVASIRSLCERWQAGTYRGLIRNGKDPVWVEREDGEWKLIPERVAAVRAGLELYLDGQAAVPIVRELTKRGLQLTDRGSESLQIYRLVRQHALVGDKELEVDGEKFILADYYPALLSRDEWNALQSRTLDRAKRHVKGDFVHLLSGMRILLCGYCGKALVGQNYGQRSRRPDGGIKDHNRRMFCVSNQKANGCPVAGSRSVAPVERAVMSYCSDMLNLQALYSGDRTSGPKSKVNAARASIAAIDAKLEKLADTLLGASLKDVPQVFLKRGRDLEDQRAREEETIKAAEFELMVASRTVDPTLDGKWRDLAAGVEAQDRDARMQARQLVSDTFESIVVYHHGRDPAQTPSGSMDIVLIAKGGVARALQIDRKGEWVHADSLSSEWPAAEDAATAAVAPA